jgi:hypothetical protein
MPSSGMLRLEALVRTDVSEERSASIFRVITIDELRNVTSNKQLTNPNDGGATLLQNVGSYKSYTT